MSHRIPIPIALWETFYILSSLRSRKLGPPSLANCEIICKMRKQRVLNYSLNAIDYWSLQSMLHDIFASCNIIGNPNFQTEKHPTITPNVQPYFFIMRTSRENPREFSVVRNFQPNLDGSIDLTMGFLRKPKN